jgi:hypothetical protein
MKRFTIRHLALEKHLMEADDILMQARTNPEATHGWVILPISRRNLTLAIAGWVFGTILGLGLFAAVAYIVIPTNYQHGILAAVVTSLLLAMLLFIGLGSLWTLIIDIGRLRHAGEHIIVITPEEFVKQEGKKIIHVPLVNVRHVTARGKAPPDRQGDALDEMPRASENITGFLFGRGLIPSGARLRRRRMRTPTSLAFIDTRTDNEVTVVTDELYGDPFMIAAQLKQYAAAVQTIV